MQWIETVVGIAEFCRSSSAKAFQDLLSVVRLETWERRSDGLDEAREDQFGPILAEGKFTVIKLLAAIQLWGPALFYEKRGLYTHDEIKNADERINPTHLWEYEDSEDDPKDTDSPQFKQDQKLRVFWDALYGATRAREMCTTVMPTYWTFDPTDRLWPRHNPYIDDMTKNTDANTKTAESAKPWESVFPDSESEPETESEEEEGSGDSDPSDGSNPSSKGGPKVKSKPPAKRTPPAEEPYDYGASGLDVILGAPNNPALEKGQDTKKG